MAQETETDHRDQIVLFPQLQPHATRPADEPQTIDSRFRRFHAAHPEVCVELVKLARRLKRAGRMRGGMKQLYEVLRWNRAIAGLPDDQETFKLSNDYTSRYARLIMDAHPDLEGFFDLRELRA